MICLGVYKFSTALSLQKRVITVIRWFLQDCDIYHIKRRLYAWLQQSFLERLISRRCDPQYGRRIHRTFHFRFLFMAIPQRQGAWQRPPEYLLPEGYTHSKNYKGGLWASHRELCLPVPNESTAPKSSLKSTFLSYSEAKY